MVDVAKGQLKALEKLAVNFGILTHNLGTEQGHSVLEVIRAFEHVIGRKVPYKFVKRRSGDADSVYANPQLAERDLNWKSSLGLQYMCEDLLGMAT